MGGEVEQVGVRYGFTGGGRACFCPAAESSDGVVERGWGVGFAVLSADVSCDGVDECVSWLIINQRYYFLDFEEKLVH